MSDFTPDGPSGGEWVAVLIVLAVFFCVCFSGAMLLQPTAAEAKESAREFVNQVGAEIEKVRDIDPVVGPVAADTLDGIGLAFTALPVIVFIVWVYYFFAKWHPQPK